MAAGLKGHLIMRLLRCGQPGSSLLATAGLLDAWDAPAQPDRSGSLRPGDMGRAAEDGERTTPAFTYRMANRPLRMGPSHLTTSGCEARLAT